MSQSPAQSYTIAEVAALTGLHKNTIRLRIKLGQIPAHRAQGKFGEEYRISHTDLVTAGLLTPTEPASTPTSSPPTESPGRGPAAPQLSEPLPPTALLELLHRHEQSIYRLGYLESELARQKALAENAESLQAAVREREMEIHTLRRDLERAQERVREIDDLRLLVRQMEHDTERMREEVERHRAAAQRRWWHFRVGRGPARDAR